MSATVVGPRMIGAFSIALLAAMCSHEANRHYCASIGDDSQRPWDESPEWQKESAIQGVQAVLDNPTITPEQLHENWMEVKANDGWVYGEVKDADAKTHPCMVAYDELPPEQRMKDQIFRRTVWAILDLSVITD